MDKTYVTLGVGQPGTIPVLTVKVGGQKFRLTQATPNSFALRVWSDPQARRATRIVVKPAGGINIVDLDQEEL